MSAIVLDHAREALIVAERANNNGNQNIQAKQGNLQGRKVISIEFYLHIAGAVLGGIAAIALTIAAISLSVFTLFAAVAACVVLCLTNALAASFIYQLTPGKEVNSVISKLYSKIHDLVKTNQDIKRESLRIDSSLEHNEFLNYKETLSKYVKKQDSELEVLQGYFEKIKEFFRENGEDPNLLEKVQKTLKKINPDDFDNLSEFFKKYHENNREIYSQFSAILPTLEKYTDRFNEDYEVLDTLNKKLEEEKARIEQEKNEIEQKLAKKEETLSDFNELSELMRSQSNS